MSERKYMLELAKSYPNRIAVESEIINLSAILNLPKGTEHFLSDIHGEHEAFLHVMRNASGAIKRKLDMLFSSELTADERAALATLIYYPEEKLTRMEGKREDLDKWYFNTIRRLLTVARAVSVKYTRSKVHKILKKHAGGFDYIINELLNTDNEKNKGLYYDNILKNVIRLNCEDCFITALCNCIIALAVDHLHIVGDIFDRGPRADLVMDELAKRDSLDIQWGNHDILWMSAACGSRTAIATIINNALTYKNLDVIEIGYGISLRSLALFADERYRDSDVTLFMPKGNYGGDLFGTDDDALIARMHKAISVIQHKLEGQVISRHPEFHMDDRLLLDKIDKERGILKLGGKEYKLKDKDFPTLDTDNPYSLTSEEEDVMKYLKHGFTSSEKLIRHVKFLYEKGGMYKIYNRNLLFHGCIPLNADGSFMALDAFGGRSGRELMDEADRLARIPFYAREGTAERQLGKDILWFLWCGKDSPLCARKKIATFERQYLFDEESMVEPKNAYYDCWQNENIVDKILAEFSLGGVESHIINGHIPVKYGEGETPIKAGGKLIVIDGGFCKAYHKVTSISGYTMIYSSDGVRICAHGAFNGFDEIINNNGDISEQIVVYEPSNGKILVRDTDDGERIRDRITDLLLLRAEYENGRIKG